MNAIILKGATLRQPPLPQSGPRAKTIAHPCHRGIYNKHENLILPRYKPKTTKFLTVNINLISLPGVWMSVERISNQFADHYHRQSRCLAAASSSGRSSAFVSNGSWPRWLAGRVQLQFNKLTKTEKKKLNSMVWVRARTIPTERPPLVGEVIANFCG
jgi:hypothetical protein